MSEHKATVRWALTGEDFSKGRYSRAHSWTFDGGATVAASASPSVVPLPYSDPAAVDPEEAYVAALSSCHMLTFLHVAYRKGFVVTTYDDEAVGVMSKNESGSLWVSQVTLRPQVTYREGAAPSPDQEDQLHEAAHHGCFIASSVKTPIAVSPRRG